MLVDHGRCAAVNRASRDIATRDRSRLGVGPWSMQGNWDHRRVESVSRLGEMGRRKFLKLAGASAAALVFGAGPFTEKTWAQTTFSSYPFSLGVASRATRGPTASSSGPAWPPTR